MLSGILGAGGFLGSALLRYARNNLEEEYIGITRENYARWAQYKLKWRTIVWAAGLSSKVICEQDKELCWKENVENLVNAINDFPCEKFIYISSAAIYQEDINVHLHRENDFNTLIPSCDQPLSWYAKCKLDGEHLVRQKVADYLILRPNGFVGPNLKKNAVYDLTRPEPKLYISWDSRLQYMHTDFFAHVLFNLSSKYSREVINIAPQGYTTMAEVANILGIDIKKVKQPKDVVPAKVYTVLNVNKLKSMLDFPLQANMYAILNWNNELSL